MSEEPRLVEVFDLDNPQDSLTNHYRAGAGFDTTAHPGGDQRPGRRPERPPSRWQRADPFVRWCTVVAVVAALIAAVIGIQATRAHRPVHERALRVPALGAMVPVDALGCPAGRSCTVQPVPAVMTDIFAPYFPGLRVVSALQTVDRDLPAGHDQTVVYRREIIAQSPKITVRLLSQCRPGGAIVDPVGLSAYYRAANGQLVFVVPGDNAPAGVRYLSITTAGASGCSLTLIVSADVDGNIVDGQPLDFDVRVLAADPRLMVQS